MLLGVDLLALDEFDELPSRRWFREYVYADEELATAGGVTPRQAAVLRSESGFPVARLCDALAREATGLGMGVWS